jgi:hypothetical protein
MKTWEIRRGRRDPEIKENYPYNMIAWKWRYNIIYSIFNEEVPLFHIEKHKVVYIIVRRVYSNWREDVRMGN